MAGVDELVTYLRLAPEFGGTRFGPFEGLEVRLGSDADRCHIVLPESLGVVSEHAKLIRQGPRNLILAPAERTATVFLYKQGARRPTQLQTPTAVRPGDAFALVTPNGPRFILELDELPPEIKEKREEARRKSRSGVGRGRLSAKSMGTEVKRQIWTRLLVMGPLQLLQRASVFIRSGAIYQPRNIIMGVMLMSGWIFGGGMSCASCRSKSRLKGTTVKYESCQQDLAMVEDMAGRDSTQYTFAELAFQITHSRRLGTALENDSDLRAEAKRYARTVLGNSKMYGWLIERNDREASAFARWREAVEESSLDDDTKKLVVWLAVMPEKERNGWDDIEDSSGNPACGRGPIRMTYRQAIHLGMDARPDALHLGSLSSIEADSKRMELLAETMSLADPETPGFPDNTTVETEHQGIDRNSAFCLYQTGDDDRARISRVLRALEDHLGPDADALPPIEAQSASTARLAKYWASDLRRMNYDRRQYQFAFTADSPTGSTLSAQESAGRWVLSHTAQTIANAVVLPCLGVLEGDPNNIKNLMGEDNLPKPVQCLILNWKLQHDE